MIPYTPRRSAHPLYPPTRSWREVLIDWLLVRKPPPLDRILKLGMVGEDVRTLQKRLYRIGFKDLEVDGQFGSATDTAVRSFQNSHNLDPDGEVGQATWEELWSPDANVSRPPLLPPPPSAGPFPPWYEEAEKWIGFHEIGANQGIEHFIAGAHCGTLGDPWCAIFVNYDVEMVGTPGTKSAAARSFEDHPNFVQLDGPAIGAITTMWRDSPTSGNGHVFLYDGENSNGVRGIAGNESDMVKRSFHERDRITGYWWPKSVPLPRIKAIIVTDSGSSSTGSET